MNTPRCGVKDNPSKVGTFSVGPGGPWENKKLLTYKITKFPKSKLSAKEVDENVRKAFDMWQRESGISFQRKDSGSVDIDIRFEMGNHGDGYPFDGPGSTLAHAFYPKYGGNAHFDETERWTLRSSSGINFLQVAAHEFGHSLGLDHSRQRRALMAPYYQGYQSNFKLHPDDVAGIQALYGKKGGKGYNSYPILTPCSFCPKLEVSHLFAIVTGIVLQLFPLLLFF